MNTTHWNTSEPPKNVAIWVTDGKLASQGVFSSFSNRWYVGNIRVNHTEVLGWSDEHKCPQVGRFLETRLKAKEVCQPQ